MHAIAALEGRPHELEELSALESEQLTDLLGWNGLFVESEDLAQREAKILGDKHAIELLDLWRSVVPVPGRVFNTR